jgi:hypothetical protein
MTGKKIEFSKKPSKQNTDKFIDSWVLGVDNTTPIVNSLKRTTIYLPEYLRQKLKFLALKENTTMTEIIITTLKQQLK